MRAITRLAGAIAATALLAGTVQAQTCFGRPYFSTGPVQVGAGANAGSGATAFGLDVGVGKDRSVYGRLGLSRAMEERDQAGPDRTGTMVNGSFGYQANLAAKRNVQVCPYAAYEQWNLEADGFDPAERDFRRTELSAGTMVGFVLPHNRSVHWVPFAGLAFARSGNSVTAAGDNRNVRHQTYTPATVGMGLHLRSQIMFTGQVMIPFGADNADPMYGLRIVLPTSRSR